MQEMIEFIDIIWQYSHYYGDVVSTVARLHDDEEDYAAILILFNVSELICKSIRQNFKGTFTEDLTLLWEKHIISDAEYSFMNDQNGIRKIRNIITHKDAYQYVIEDSDGYALSLAEPNTWSIIYNDYALKIVKILTNIVVNGQLLNLKDNE